MSRSRKKNAAGGITSASSEKYDKKLWHKKYRRKNKILKKSINDDNEIEFYGIKEVSNPWIMDKDGKTIYFTELDVRQYVEIIYKKISKNKIDAIYENNLLKEYIIRNILDEMCVYFKINKNQLQNASEKNKTKFIEYFINKYKRK